MTNPGLVAWPSSARDYRRFDVTEVVGHGDAVRLTVRSLTRAAPQQPWRDLYPLLMVAQLIARKRYLRSLR
ncbi:hypothetical protein [Cryobacterium sp. PH31-O1]|uniref:hypothetical protein n=1 Tax=Cryobacterium sp. PH31-O1 TaxID=3046306 RepID=UPI0024B97E12|nr:hypothetical protein [Cryobacterium sp. PH31-O1]MDJ0337691.1 hypothetical protein [Cryobacterium sp. PH31-O1]